MKTYRIGIIGSENSHARAFAKVFAKEPDFQDMKVVAVFGNEGREKSEKVQEYFPEAVIVDRPEEMLGLVDAVMITSRDGKFHYPYAKPFLEAGIPMFIMNGHNPEILYRLMDGERVGTYFVAQNKK